jgi:hypothetical protein
LVTLLWHNNGFDEPERQGAEWAYEELLDRLAGAQPWCAPGSEIAAWWRAQQPHDGNQGDAPSTGI